MADIEAHLDVFADLKNLLELRLMVVAIIVVSSLPLLLRIYADYLAYKALGPGGTPSTPIGFLKIKVLSLFAVADPYKPQSVLSEHHQSEGYLRTNLPPRIGPRPEVRGIAPQRQTTQKAPVDIFHSLTHEIERLAVESNGKLEVGTSCIEKHGTGLFVTSRSDHTKHRCKTEVCHAHASDGSLHLSLHPADAKVMLEAGWGERHPLSRGGRFERFVPAGFVSYTDGWNGLYSSPSNSIKVVLPYTF